MFIYLLNCHHHLLFNHRAHRFSHHLNIVVFTLLKTSLFTNHLIFIPIFLFLPLFFSMLHHNRLHYDFAFRKCPFYQPHWINFLSFNPEAHLHSHQGHYHHQSFLHFSYFDFLSFSFISYQMCFLYFYILHQFILFYFHFLSNLQNLSYLAFPFPFIYLYYSPIFLFPQSFGLIKAAWSILVLKLILIYLKNYPY